MRAYVRLGSPACASPTCGSTSPAGRAAPAFVSTSVREQVGVLRVPPDVGADERARRHDLDPLGAEVVERAAHEHGAVAAPFEVAPDLRVHERPHPAALVEVDQPDRLAVAPQLVPPRRLVLDDLESALVHHGWNGEAADTVADSSDAGTRSSDKTC